MNKHWTIVGLGLLVSGCYTGGDFDAAADASGGIETDGSDTQDDDSGGSSGGTDGTGEDPGELDCQMGPQVGEDSLVRLTLRQYDATVRDLVGVDASVARTSFSADVRLGESTDTRFTAGAPVSALVAKQLMLGAESIADQVDVSALTDCDGGDTCMDAFVLDFGRRGFRRPLSEAEAAVLRSIYDAEPSHDAGVRALVQAMLQSPAFLYLLLPDTQGAAPGEIVALDDWAVASRMSYFLWGTMPDAELFAAAQGGTLSSDEGIRAELARMLADPRAEAGIREFYDAVIELDFVETITKDATAYPEFSTELAGDLHESLWLGLRALHLEGDGTLASLIDAVPLYANARLSNYYGFSGANSETFEPVAELGGLLSHPGMAALLSKPGDTAIVERGLFVRGALLCSPLPPPPPGVEPELPEGGDWDTPRERLAQHREDPACAGCHNLIDPIGYAMENLDADGRTRALWPSGVPVDASGELLLGADAYAFEGLPGLESALSDQPQYEACMVNHWLTFATRRVPGELDACVVDGILAETSAQNGSLDALMEAIVLSDGFRLVQATE